MCDTYHYDYLQHTTFRFYLLTPIALLKDRIFKENASKKSKNPSLFSPLLGSNNSLTLIENNFRFLR